MTDALDTFLAQFAGPARPEGVTAALRALVRRRARDWIMEAELCSEVHRCGHWRVALDDAAHVYLSEEAYWEDVLELKSWRAVTKRLQVGAALERIPADDRATVRQDFAALGLAKCAILAPLLESWLPEPWDAAQWAVWRGLAQGSPPARLQRHVSDALGAKARGMSPPGQKFRDYVVGKMPDMDSQQLAAEFFRVGARVAESQNPVAVMIAGMQEALAAWQPRVSAP